MPADAPAPSAKLAELARKEWHPEEQEAGGLLGDLSNNTLVKGVDNDLWSALEQLNCFSAPDGGRWDRRLGRLLWVFEQEGSASD